MRVRNVCPDAGAGPVGISRRDAEPRRPLESYQPEHRAARERSAVLECSDGESCPSWKRPDEITQHHHGRILRFGGRAAVLSRHVAGGFISNRWEGPGKVEVARRWWDGWLAEWQRAITVPICRQPDAAGH